MRFWRVFDFVAQVLLLFAVVIAAQLACSRMDLAAQIVIVAAALGGIVWGLSYFKRDNRHK